MTFCSALAPQLLSRILPFRMSPNPQSNRRDFLRGKAAARTVQSWLSPNGDEPSPSELRAKNLLVEFTRKAMATQFQVILDAQKDSAGPDAAMEALDTIEALEDQLSVYRPHSEVSQINAHAAERVIQVDHSLFELLSIGKRLWEQTSGAFDMTAGPLSRAWGFHQRRGEWPSDEALREALQRVGSDALQLDARRRTVSFSRSGCEINLGAIGKGWALDRAAERMDEADVGDFLLHGGSSSVLARGSRHQQQGWTVGVTHPLAPNRRLGSITLEDEALATSGCGNQFFHHQGRRLSHILDPRTGMPAEGVLSATVISASATEADALATAVYVMGLEETRDFLERRPDLKVILVTTGKRRGAVEIHLLNVLPEQWREAGTPDQGDLEGREF